MELRHALDIAEDCKRIYRLLGNQSAYPYHQEQIVRAMIALFDEQQRLQAGADSSVPAAELTLCKRRYAALNARYTLLCKQTGKKIEESPYDEDGAA